MSLAELEKFTNEMKEVGRKVSGSPGNIAQVSVQFGWHRYISKELGFWAAWVPVPTKSKSDVAKEACFTILRDNGSTESPSFGLRTYIFGETALPTAWKSDSGEFVASWQADKFNMLLERLIRVEGFAFNKTLWARIKNVPDPYFVAQGEDGKTVLRTDRDGKTIKDSNGDNIYDYKTIRVITEVFPNKIAAKKAADEGASSSNSTLELSAKAKAGNVSVEDIKGQADYITEERNKEVSDEVIADALGVAIPDLELAFVKVETPF